MDNKKIKILEAGNSLGLGGTEYAIQLYSKFLNKTLFDVTVVGIYEGGERVQLIEDLGINVVLLNGDLAHFAALLDEADVLHWHGNGKLEIALFDIVAKHKPPMIIQTNVFGNFRESYFYQLVDYDLYISKMILIRRMYYDSYLKNTFFKKRKVLHYPVDVDEIYQSLPSPEAISQFKEKHHLEDQFIVGRIGRADQAKFDLIALDGFAAFAEKIDKARFLLVGATESMLEHADKLGIQDKLTVVDNTPDMKSLMLYYKCLDVFLAASNMGESFGMVIAEAMTAGIPVLTISTKDKDNAQVELVDNEVTGLVVKRDTGAIADALSYLHINPAKRKFFAKNAREKVVQEYDAKQIINSFEQLVLKHFKPSFISTTVSKIQSYSREMVNDYQERCKDLWEPGVSF